MCTGAELIGLIGAGVSTAGGLVTANEQNKNAQRQAQARNDELKKTLLKNDPLAEKSRDAFEDRLNKTQADEFAQQQHEATDTRQDELATAADEAPQAAQEVSLSGSAPTVVKSDLARRMGDAMKASKQQAQSLGKLGGYGDTWLGQGIMDTEAGRDIAQNANFAGGNLAILPYKQDIAESRAYKPISPLGGLMQGLGSMASSYGGSKAAGVPKKQYTSGYI